MPVTLAAAFQLGGVNVEVARLPELLCGLGLIIVVFRLGYAWGMPEAGAIAALLMSVDNTLFLAARTVRPEAFVAFFGSLSVLCYFLSRQKHSVGFAVLCGLFAGIALNYHVNGFAVALSIGLLLLIEFGWSIWWQKRAWAIVLTAAATLVPFSAWVISDPVRIAAFQRLYTRGQALTLVEIARSEWIRYADYLGYSNQRLHLFSYGIPLRLHVILLFVVSLVVLLRNKRKLFWTILALVVPSLVLWTKEVNPTARFFVIIAPYLAMAVGAALVLVERPRLRALLAALCLIVALTQAAGNILILRQYRTADYESLSRRLRSSIPPDARVYAAITFFMALHDRTFYSWNRTPLDYAITKLGVNYLILNDRVLAAGSGYGKDDWKEIRGRASEFVRDRADLVARVPDRFYGDLEIYRVRSN